MYGKLNMMLKPTPTQGEYMEYVDVPAVIIV